MITVEFRSQQKRLLKDEKGELVDDENRNLYRSLTFERDISPRDPNWLLVETESVQCRCRATMPA